MCSSITDGMAYWGGYPDGAPGHPVYPPGTVPFPPGVGAPPPAPPGTMPGYPGMPSAQPLLPFPGFAMPLGTIPSAAPMMLPPGSDPPHAPHHQAHSASMNGLAMSTSMNEFPPGSMTPLLTAEELAEEAKDVIPMTCNTEYNMNSLIVTNINSSEYWRMIQPIATLEDLFVEIKKEVTHVKPFVLGKSTQLPSTAFMLLYKLFHMRLKFSQLKAMLNNKENPYIRALGFLWIRFVADVKTLEEWLDPYIDDFREFSPTGRKDEKVTFGQFVQGLMTDMKYYDTMLRRIPIPTGRAFKLKLMAKVHAYRKSEYVSTDRKMTIFFCFRRGRPS